MNPFLILLVFLVLISSCESNANSCDIQCQKIEQDVNTPVPQGLEDAEIIVRTKDGKEHKMSANDFKVVKRKQQFKVKERVIVKMQPMPREAIERGQALLEQYVDNSSRKNKKNMLMLGVSDDYRGVSSETYGTTTKVYSNKGAVMDLTYYRRRVFDSAIGLGVGINTNEVLRGVIGLEF